MKKTYSIIVMLFCFTLNILAGGELGAWAELEEETGNDSKGFYVILFLIFIGLFIRGIFSKDDNKKDYDPY